MITVLKKNSIVCDAYEVRNWAFYVPEKLNQQTFKNVLVKKAF